MDRIFKIGNNYKDILSLSKNEDQFVSWFSYNGSGIGNSGGIRSAKYLKINSDIPCYMVLITRNISHRCYNPWEDIVDFSTGSIFYWGDAKADENKDYNQFRGNRHLIKVYEKILENKLDEVPPILHFSKINRGLVKFNGLCVLKNLEITWFEDKGVPVKNYRIELAILNTDKVNVKWLHERVNSESLQKVNQLAPKIWKDYIKGNISRLDIWSKRILKKDEQMPPPNSNGSLLLDELTTLMPVEFEAVVVEMFRNLPHVNHKIYRTRPTADGGFDFYGQFSIPYPVKYEIEFLGEVKKFGRNNAVQPKHVSRLVARLNRGQFGIFVTTSYYTVQTQKEVLEDGYPVKLFTGNDLINILHELRLVEKGKIKDGWIKSITEKI